MHFGRNRAKTLKARSPRQRNFSVIKPGITAAKILLSVASIAGAYSVYLFSFTGAFGFGVRTLIDSRFIFNACFSLTIFVLGNLVFFRIMALQFFLMRRLKKTDSDDSLDRSVGRIKKTGFRRFSRIPLLALAAIVSAYLYYSIFKSFLDLKSMIIFGLIMFSMVAVLGSLVYAVDGSALRQLADRTEGRTFTLSEVLRIFSLAGSIVPFLVSCVLLACLFLGAMRFTTLVNSKPVCFETDIGEIQGALLGETEFGYFWTEKKPQPYEFLDSGAENSYVNFLSRASVKAIGDVCL